MDEFGSNHLKYHLNLAAWVLSGVMNATESCARCFEGLGTMSGEGNVRFIALYNRFYWHKAPVYGQKSGRITLKDFSIKRRG